MNMHDMGKLLKEKAELEAKLLDGGYMQFGNDEGACVITFWKESMQVDSMDLRVVFPYGDIGNASFPFGNDALRIETNEGAIINVRVRG